MNRADFDALVAATVARTADLLVKKGDEYTGEADRLANFKRNAAKNGQTVLDCWMVYWGKHVDSINTYMARVKDEAVKLALQDYGRAVAELISSQRRAPVSISDEEKIDALADPAHFRHAVNTLLPVALDRINKQLTEPIEGRFDDNINYSILCQAILAELRRS